MDPADGTARALKRRRLYDHTLDQYQSQPQHADSGRFDGDCSGTQTAFGKHDSFSCSIDRVNVGIDAAELRALQQDDSVECCYGMLSGISVAHRQLLSIVHTSSNHVPVSFECPNSLSSIDENSSYVFNITDSLSHILSQLKAVAEISTQLYCYTGESPQERSAIKDRRKLTRGQVWLLNIIIYGPFALGETIGGFLSSFGIYLQDPVGCNRRMPYRNPHLFSDEPEETTTESFKSSQPPDIEIECLKVGRGLLAQLMEDETPLEETETPAIVTTDLFPHQKQALTFMLCRERGWNMNIGSRDIWARETDTWGRIGYRNKISGLYQTEVPQAFHGGLLADDMGLGKTLSMISVIAANQASQLHSPPVTPERFDRAPFKSVKTTLLVVPPSLIHVWEKQFRQHTRPAALIVYLFHGQSKKEIDSLDQYDVVITTFHTVSSIWRKMKGSLHNSKSIFSVMWHRIVLDEAHMIQNPQSQLAQACCALRAERRWAVTGTPIQNKLTDFASILQFLCVYPYSENDAFHEDISRPWHRGDPQGFLRLKTLVKAITISRTKSVVRLPSRIDEIHHLEFAPPEREMYDVAKREAVTLLEEAISSGNQSGKSFNALKRLNTLRLICCQGLLTRSKQAVRSNGPIQNFAEVWSHLQSSTSASGDLIGSSVNCSICGVGLLDDFLEGSLLTGLDNVQQTYGCGSMLCEQCSSQLNPSRPGQEPSQLAEDMAPSTIKYLDFAAIGSMSTKVNALLVDILKHQRNEKSVVFSFWTHTLDLVQLMLDYHNIGYTRIDGKTTLSKRTEALRAFEEQDPLRVILISITCGGAGLDLTAASRVYLLEPHWNPMIEEQALCRVHRVGQQQAVTTIRYLMKDSFEEQVVEIQKRKIMLAQVTFGQGSLSEDGIGLGVLQYLRSVLK